MGGDPPEQLGGSLDDDAVVPRQVASAEHRKRVLGERRRHVRTVRSAARSRNRPRPHLAWLLLVILLVLIALAARVAAAPSAPDDDDIALAIRYANALTGVDLDNPSDSSLGARALDGPDDLDDDGEDDGEDDGDDDDDDGTDDADEPEPRTGRGAVDASDGDTGREVSAMVERLAASAGEDDPGDGDAGDGAIGGPASFASVAVLDTDPVDPGAAMGADAAIAATQAGAAETYESWMRHQRPSRWGRLDLGLAWRHRVSEPLQAMANRYDEVWLVATWRR